MMDRMDMGIGSAGLDLDRSHCNVTKVTANPKRMEIYEVARPIWHL